MLRSKEDEIESDRERQMKGKAYSEKDKRDFEKMWQKGERNQKEVR